VDQLRRLGVGRRVLRLARTTFPAFALVMLFTLASAAAFLVSKDPAPLVISFLAYGDARLRRRSVVRLETLQKLANPTTCAPFGRNSGPWGPLPSGLGV
jgi:hypothetical protein